ncbi:2-hydroxy-3-oxopropionate reductase [bioreactor metagenome]|jgi:2-hydroxy-3-oxopropionate reductase|uniref:2-hydroxy-3-oxopropionate reductase n=1 Tax=bioreactor metagenome TaxID=1076179 RepID=A0A644WGU9_9ZZZZ|nr:2-hydroxy-3-oxopropionate reductase [Synergistaceae bacterium]NCB17153.1 2-hydroxy-3-oxopropionate reductase [Synergistales bacterium]HPF85487.1 2-hydroxy-3-oxopropionate reductase [Aminivibrio sp.]
MQNIGFIGLGIMGKPMAKNLLKAGKSLVVYDIVPAAVEELVSEGAQKGTSPKDVAERSDMVITMLPNSPHVKEAVCGEKGILEGAKKGQIIVDMSSIAPLVSRELGALLAEKGAEMLDAPVSGGQEKAEKGTLAIMVGGSEASYEKVKDILAFMGKSTLVGDLGAGQTTKLVNQSIVAVNIAAVAEGMAFAKKAGVDPEKVFNAIRGGLAGSQCMEDKAPRMFEGRYNPGFRINLHIKDLNNVLETSRSLHVSMPLTAQLMEMFQNLAADGHETLDHGALGLFYEKLNTLSLKK